MSRNCNERRYPIRSDKVYKCTPLSPPTMFYTHFFVQSKSQFLFVWQKQFNINNYFKYFTNLIMNRFKYIKLNFFSSLFFSFFSRIPSDPLTCPLLRNAVLNDFLTEPLFDYRQYSLLIHSLKNITCSSEYFQKYLRKK